VDDLPGEIILRMVVRTERKNLDRHIKPFNQEIFSNLNFLAGLSGRYLIEQET